MSSTVNLPPVQKLGARLLDPTKQLSKQELQNNLITLFVEMAKTMKPQDDHSDKYPLSAMRLTIDNRDKAQLLKVFTDALSFKKPPNYQHTRIFYLQQGIALKDITNDCKSGFYLRLGEAYLGVGDLDNALKSFKEGLTLLPYEERRAEFNMEIGKIYLINDPDEALKWLNEAMKYTKSNFNLKYKINNEIIKALNKKLESKEKTV
jgi:tetratricopeptide (TPR) repeat protein